MTHRSDLLKLAAECHREKWAFDISDEEQLKKANAYELANRAFAKLQRIGDMAKAMAEALKEEVK
jgi:hypothetical protein